jgi:hypothetical protein
VTATRRSCFGRLAPACKARLSLSWKSLSLFGCSPRRYFGGPPPSPGSHLATVLRDIPVMREISRADFLFRLCRRRILPLISMVIIPLPQLLKEAAGSVVHLAQFSVGANTPMHTVAKHCA